MSETLTFGPAHSRASLKRVFDGLLDTVDRAALVQADPVELVHRYRDPHDQEVVGLIVAMMAYGRVRSIKAKAELVLQALGPHPARAVQQGRRGRRLSGFVYRFQKQEDLPRFLAAVGRVRRRHGSLAAAFAAHVESDARTYAPAMSAFVHVLGEAVSGPLSYGLRFMLPDCSGGGASKRLCLFLRWMIRPADGLDLGAWRTLAPGLSPARLIMPLDTHVARISRYIGLTERRSNDLRCALQITSALRDLAPEDPLVYDMALCHLGISGQCPKRRDVLKCQGCPIRRVCRLGPPPAGWSKV